MGKDATQEQVARVIDEVTRCGLKVEVSPGESCVIIDTVGDEGRVPFPYLATLAGVLEARKIDAPYKLISREYSKFFNQVIGDRQIKVGNSMIGSGSPVYIAGPCAVESESQLKRIAEGVKLAGAHILRGGIFKPRSSVHSFQGLGAVDWKIAEEALKWMQQAGREFNMPVVTEVRGENQLDLIAEYVDILQIGARNMYDQDLLTAVAKKNKPVLLKRHFGASFEEFLSFAEYIAAEHNRNIILCERGIIPVGKGKSYTRYTLDLGSVPVIKKETYLPVIVDPSHAMGRSDLIFSMSCAAIAAGASGLMIEVHYNPREAQVDGNQSITPSELERVINACNDIHRAMELACEKDLVKV